MASSDGLACRIVCGAVLAVATVGALAASGSAAFASAGCDAVNAGGFNDTVSYPPPASVKTISGFAAGDRITFSITTGASPGWLDASWQLTPSASATVLTQYSGASGFPGVTLGSYTVTGSGDTALKSNYQAIYIQNFGLYSTGSATISAACTPGVSTSGVPTDSQKLRTVQVQGSIQAAQTSGAAITDAVGSAIGDAFANGGNPATIGPGGIAFNFAADPQAGVGARSGIAQRTDEAFAALAYAGKGPPTKAPRTVLFERQWSLWADIRGTGLDRANGINGAQLNATAGLGYRITSDVLVGVFGGYENFRYDFASLTGRLRGAGGTVGAYAGWRILPTLRWDAMLGWSGLGYDANAGAATGSLSAQRWLASTGLTGTYRVATYILEPSAKVYALWEQQRAWTDSLGTLQDARWFSAGRVALGGRVIVPWQVSSTLSLSPYAGFYGDWRFSTDNAVPAGQPVVGIGNGWSGRITGGLMLSGLNGGSLALGGEYGGLGAGYKIWTGSVRAQWTF